MKIKIVLVVVMILATYIYKNHSLNKLLKELYKLAYVYKDEDGFLLQLSSLQAQMLMSNTSRKIMELNYWIYKDNKENVEKIAGQLKKHKMNTNNAISFYSLVIGYFADKKDAKALEYLEELKSNCKLVSDPKQELLINDCEMACKIYINKDTSLIPTIEKILEEDLDNEAKSIYQYRLAYLYKLNNNIDECKFLLKEAMNNTSNIKSKNKIKSILNSGCETL